LFRHSAWEREKAPNVMRIAIPYITAALMAVSPTPWSQNAKYPRYILERPDENIDALDGRNFLGMDMSPELRFRIVRHGTKTADIQVDSGNSRFTAADITVFHPLTVRKPDQVYHPGQSALGYRFYLSPNAKYLFVVRSCNKFLTVCYLYRRSTKDRMLIVQPNNLRFDEAAARFVLRQNHSDSMKPLLGERGAEFNKWSSDSLTFNFRVWSTFKTFKSPAHNDRDDAESDLTFDIASQRFKMPIPQSDPRSLR
jgi:hypothetical protein